MKNAKKKTPKPRTKPIGGTGILGLSLKQLDEIAKGLGLHVAIEPMRGGNVHWVVARRDTGHRAGSYTPHLKRFSTVAVPYAHTTGVEWMNALERLAAGRR